MMRILHFSDIHFPLTFAGSAWVERLQPKRFLAALNYGVRRRNRFRDAPAKWEAFRTFIGASSFDAVICTGDLTAAGMSGELSVARDRMQFLFEHPGFILMPGNHDVYLPGVHERQYARFFSGALSGKLIRPSGAGNMPYARLIGDRVAVVAVNSVKPNPCIWRSSGLVDGRQMEWTRALLAHEALRDRLVLVATHYNSDDQDSGRHGLENRVEFRRMLSEYPRVKAVLHGHVHHGCCMTAPGWEVPMYCAGSLTYRGRESFWVFETDGKTFAAHPGIWDGTQYRLRANTEHGTSKIGH